MTEYIIEVTERIEFKFKVSAESKKEAEEIAKESWEIYSPENMDVMVDSDIDIKVYETRRIIPQSQGNQE